MSTAGRHSRVPSIASASSDRDGWMEADPPYQQPWLNHLVKILIFLHNAVVIPFIMVFTSVLYAAISDVFGHPICPTPDPSNGAIVILNSTAGNAASIPFPSWLHTVPRSTVFLRTAVVAVVLPSLYPRLTGASDRDRTRYRLDTCFCASPSTPFLHVRSDSDFVKRGWTVFAYGESRDQAHEVLSPTRATGPSSRVPDLSMVRHIDHSCDMHLITLPCF